MAYFRMHSGEGPVEQPTAVAAQTSVDRPLRVRSLPMGLAVGQSEVFELTLSNTVTTSSMQVLSDIHLKGELALVGLGRGQVHATFSGDVNGESVARDAPELSERFRSSFALTFDDRGRFLSAQLPRAVPEFVGRLWAGLGALVQFAGSDSERWTSTESDLVGTFAASYERAAKNTFNKRKIAYTSIAAERVSYSVEEGVASIRFDDAGQWSGTVGRERLRASVGTGPIPEFVASTDVHLERVRGPFVVGDLANYKLVDVTTVAPSKSFSQVPQSGALEARRKGWTVSQSISGLAPFGSGTSTKSDLERAQRAFSALVAHLTVDEKALGLVVAAIEADGPLSSSLLAALRDAGGEGCQSALARFAGSQSPISPDNRLEAARALSAVANPSPGTVSALNALRADPLVGVQAKYGLGTVYHRLESSNPGLAGIAHDALNDELRAAQSPAELVSALVALGNAGDVGLIEHVRVHAASPITAVREAAAQALRRIEGTEADELLLGLARDQQAAVRLSAVDAIGERRPTTIFLELVQLMAKSEPELVVRGKCIALLGQWVALVPALRATLEIIAQSESDENLKAYAANLVNRSG